MLLARNYHAYRRQESVAISLEQDRTMASQSIMINNLSYGKSTSRSEMSALMSGFVSIESAVFIPIETQWLTPGIVPSLPSLPDFHLVFSKVWNGCQPGVMVPIKRPNHTSCMYVQPPKFVGFCVPGERLGEMPVFKCDIRFPSRYPAKLPKMRGKKEKADELMCFFEWATNG